MIRTISKFLPCSHETRGLVSAGGSFSCSGYAPSRLSAFDSLGPFGWRRSCISCSAGPRAGVGVSLSLHESGESTSACGSYSCSGSRLAPNVFPLGSTRVGWRQMSSHSRDSIGVGYLVGFEFDSGFEPPARPWEPFGPWDVSSLAASGFSAVSSAVTMSTAPCRC